MVRSAAMALVCSIMMCACPALAFNLDSLRAASRDTSLVETDRLEAQMYVVLGTMFNDPLAAYPDVQRYHRMAEAAENANFTAHSLHYLGYYYRSQLQFDSAEAVYRQSLAIGQETNQPKHVANAYADLGVLAQDRGELTKALEWFELGRTESEEHNLPGKLARCVLNL